VRYNSVRDLYLLKLALAPLLDFAKAHDAPESRNLFAVDSVIAGLVRNTLIENGIFFSARLVLLREPLLDRFATETPLPPDFNAPQLAAFRPQGMLLGDTANSQATREVVNRGAIVKFAPYIMDGEITPGRPPFQWPPPAKPAVTHRRALPPS